MHPSGGGGGAGGLLEGAFSSATFSFDNAYTVTVGAGGNGCNSDNCDNGANGGNSGISTLIATGGGVGGSFCSGMNNACVLGKAGGSSGGNSAYCCIAANGDGPIAYTNPPFAAVAGQGNIGDRGNFNTQAGGGNCV